MAQQRGNRGTPRTELTLRAKASGHQIAWECQVRNFCDGGLYLQCGRTEGSVDTGFRPPFPSEQLRIAFLAPDPKGAEMRYEVRVRVAHVEQGGFGAAFLGPEPQALQALSRLYQRRAESGASSGNGRPPPAERLRLLDQLARTLLSAIRERAPRFLKGAIALFPVAAQKAGSPEDREEFLRVAGVWQQQGIDMLEEWLLTLRGRIHGLSGEPGGAEAGKGEIELVDKERFEKWVVAAGIATATEARLARPLDALEQRLSWLCERSVDRDSNPFGPGVILQMFQERLDSHGIGLSSLRLLLGLLDREVLGGLDPAYDALNEMLRQAGVLPDLTQGMEKATEKASAPQEKPVQGKPTSPSAAPAQPPARPTAGPSSRGVFGTLSSLFQGRKPSPPEGEGGEPPHEYGVEAAMAALNRAAGETQMQSLGERLQRVLERDGGSGVLSAEVRGAVGAAEGLVQSFRVDEVLPTQMRGAMQALEVPLARMALEEPEFLNSDDHPAVKVINDLERLAVVLSAEPENSRPAQEIRAVIDRTIAALGQERKAGADPFLEAQQHLEPFLERYQNQFSANTQRVVESRKGEQRLQAAKQQVRERLASSLAGRSVPRLTLQLLGLGWNSLLVTSLLQEGEQGAKWQGYLGAVDRFIDWFDPTRQGPPGPSPELSEFLAILEQGFSEVPSNPLKQAKLVELLRRALGGDATLFQQVQQDGVVLQHKAESEGAGAELAPEERQRLESWFALVERIAIGDWVVEQRPDHVSRPLSLVWRDEEAARFAFVDGKGMRSLECSRVELAGSLEAGRLSVLEDGGLPLVQRAVQRVIKRTYEKLQFNAGHDPLTGLINRRSFATELERVIEQAEHDNSQHVVIQVDIDQFKVVNDICGMEGGDRLLGDIAHVLKTYLGGKGVLARVGNDQFGILVENCTTDDGFAIAEIERRAIDNYVFTWDGRRISVTASIGLVPVDSSTTSASSVLRNMDAACGLAKGAGRNRVKVYAANDRELVRRQGEVAAVTLVEEAVQQGRLQLFLQRITPVFMDEGLLEHYEVLLRVIGADNKPIPPQDFIKAAEEYGRMRVLDRWVIDHLFDWIERNGPRITECGGFSVNLSGQSVGDPHISSLIQRRVGQNHFPAARIAFEITETSMIRNMEQAVAFMGEIKGMGCEFYLDDFGSGLASYSYLKDLPVDCVKIDGAFIRNIATDDNDYAFVKSITEVAHFMKKRVIAEFVESEATLVRLQELGVDYVQGYVMGRPFPLHKLLD